MSSMQEQGKYFEEDKIGERRTVISNTALLLIRMIKIDMNMTFYPWNS